MAYRVTIVGIDMMDKLIEELDGLSYRDFCRSLCVIRWNLC